MHALIVRVTIHDADTTREVLNSQVVPQASSAPGFKTGYWTWPTGGGELNGLSISSLTRRRTHAQRAIG
jgi:hypothetical protein